MGASGDLAKKKTYPTLYNLYAHGYFPEKIRIVGYARSKLTKEELVSSLGKYIKATTGTSYFSRFSYCDGCAREYTLSCCTSCLRLAKEYTMVMRMVWVLCRRGYEGESIQISDEDEMGVMHPRRPRREYTE